MLLDLTGLIVCFNVAHNLRVNTMVSSPLALVYLISTTLLCLYTFNTYTIETPNKGLRVVSRTIIACLFAFLIAILSGFLIGREAFIPLYGRTILFVAFALFIIWACLVRYLANRLNFNTNDNRWLFIGSQSLAAEFNKDFGKHKYTGHLVCHIISDTEIDADTELKHYQKLILEQWNGVIIDSLNSLTE